MASKMAAEYIIDLQSLNQSCSYKAKTIEIISHRYAALSAREVPTLGHYVTVTDGPSDLTPYKVDLDGYNE